METLIFSFVFHYNMQPLTTADALPRLPLLGHPHNCSDGYRWAKPDDPVQTANNAKRVMEGSYFAIV